MQLATWLMLDDVTCSPTCLFTRLLKKHSINTSWEHGTLWVRQETQKKTEDRVTTSVGLDIYLFQQEEEGKRKQLQVASPLERGWRINQI